MNYIGFLLHLYQPPNQFHFIVHRIVEECYRPLLTAILNHPRARFTLNMNWSLTEKLLELGHKDILSMIAQGVRSGKLELTGSAAYHAILPLIPETERFRQIEVNIERHRSLWGDLYEPTGFFPPEMAYGPEIIRVLKPFGFKWVITEDIPYNCIHGQVPWNFIPEVEDVGVLLRSSYWSNKISLEKDSRGLKFTGKDTARWLTSDLAKWFSERDGYIILAMDGETFGHHIPGYVDTFLVQFLDTLGEFQDTTRLAFVSDIYEKFPKVEADVPPGSWSTNAEDFWSGNFFPLWKNRSNQVHHLLWQLTGLALESVNLLRDKMDRSLASCTFWWAATKPDEVSPITEMGIDSLMEVIRIANPDALNKATDIRRELSARLNVTRRRAVAHNEERTGDHKGRRSRQKMSADK